VVRGGVEGGEGEEDGDGGDDGDDGDEEGDEISKVEFCRNRLDLSHSLHMHLQRILRIPSPPIQPSHCPSK